MEVKPKRFRSSNFTGEEKILLLNLVKKYSDIIENKKTDAQTWRSKEETWTKITNEFNAQNTVSEFRSKEAIKRLYENKKKETRKVAAMERKEIFKTGGGTKVSVIKDPTFELTMAILNKKTVLGFPSICDGDKNEPSPCRQENNYAIANPKETRSMEEAEEEEEEREEAMPVSENRIEVTQDSQEQKSVTTKDVTGDRLLINKNKKFQIKSPTWSSRRRPSLCPTGNVAKKYEDLGEVKLQVARVQFELLQNEKGHQQKKFKMEIEEMERKRSREEEEDVTNKSMKLEKYERDKEESELRKKCLDLDIKLKEAQLRALNSI